MEKAEKPDKPQEEKKKKGIFAPKKAEIRRSYTVKAGDTLSAIAKKFYGDETEYMKIYEANKDLIGSSPEARAKALT